MKKLILILLALATVATLVSCSKEEKDDDLSNYLQEEVVLDKITLDNGETYYIDTLDTTSVKITKYIGSEKLHALEIPKTLNNKKVVAIGDSAFYYCTAITSVKIPDSVTEIGEFAFAGCSFLTEINLPATVKTLGKAAFYGCSGAKTLTIPEGGISEIPESAFYNCSSLTAVNIPSTVKTVGKAAFYGCSELSSLSVSDGVEEIKSQAFQNLSKLATVSLPKNIVLGENAFAGTAWEK